MDLTFDQIVLSKDELSFLTDLFSCNTWIHENNVPQSLDTDNLVELGFVHQEVFDDDLHFIITNLGASYFLYLKRSKSRYRTELILSIAAIFVSVIALIVSAISLRLQILQQ